MMARVRTLWATRLPAAARVCVALSLGVPGIAGAQADPRPRVELTSGPVIGRRSADGMIASFRGIPYAAAPTGALRWMPPKPVRPWSEPRDAGAFGDDCVQLPSPWLPRVATRRFSENCLYLNVWSAAKPGAGAPVLVWIHGGGFVSGGTALPEFDGEPLARKGVVFVSLNYRLGRLGFFAHPALSAKAHGPLGNYGYLDQIAALHWVQANIAAFGGDPGRVTIMGESAGGISVLDLLTSPAARGLFRQAIVMSGGGRAAMSNRPLDGAIAASDFGDRGQRVAPGTAEQVGLAFARSQGITGRGAKALAALRRLPAERLMAGLAPATMRIDGDVKASLPELFGTHVGGPIVDGRIKRAITDLALSRGDQARVPVMIGSTSADLSVQTGQDKDQLFAAFGPLAAQARAIFDPEGTVPLPALREEITRDRLLVEPARFAARTMAAAGQPTYLYSFGYVSDSKKTTWPGVPHGADTAYFLGTAPQLLGNLATARDRHVADQTSSYVARFVATGSPGGTGAGAWTDLRQSTATIMTFAADGTIGLQADPQKAKLDLIEKTANGLQQEQN